MQSLKLSKTVQLYGKDFLGRRAMMSFAPAPRPGWYVQADRAAASSIGMENVCSKFRRLVVSKGPYRLNCYEHIAPLRWMGLANVILDLTPRTPYFSSPFDVWKHIQPHCETDEETVVPWVTINRAFDWFYPNSQRYTKISPATEPSLKVRIIVDYPGLGKREGIFTIPPLNERIITVPTQGWPPSLYYLSYAASLLGWPHHDRITWAKQYSPQVALERFIWHRLTDILGALTLIHPHRLFAGEVVSHCSGHRADIACVRQAQGSLVEL